MNTEFQQLIEWADTDYTERDSEFIDKWLSGKDDVFSTVDNLALFLAKSYVDGSISFDIVSTLLNQTMPVIDFEKKPEVFWSFYLAFEDFELLENPDKKAKLRIKSELAAINAI